MPNPIPAPVKTCVINNITVENCLWSDFITANLNNFEDVPGIIAAFVDKFEVRPPYLSSLLDCFDGYSADLQAVGVYYKISGASVTNPVIIVDSTFPTGATVNLSATSPYLIVFGQNTIVDRISVTSNLDYIRIGGGAYVRLVKTTIAGSPITSGCVKLLNVSAKNNIYSSLQGVETDSCIESIKVGKGSFFGGENYCLDVKCSEEISNLASSSQDVLPQSVLLTWNNPASTAGSSVYYKLTNTNLWYKVNWEKDKFGVHGNFTSPLVGFAVFGLQPLTSYDFKVTNICISGFESDGLVVTQKTVTEC